MYVITIMIGGFLGAVLRASIGTFISNLIGAFIIGFIFKGIYNKVISSKLKPLLTTGFLGTLTTFSSFGLEVFQKFEKSLYIEGIEIILVTNILGLLLVYLGTKFSDMVLGR